MACRSMLGGYFSQQPRGILMTIVLEQASRLVEVLRNAEASRVDSRQCDSRTRESLGSARDEVGKDSFVMGRQLVINPVLVEGLKQALGRVAQSRGLADQHGDCFPDPPLPKKAGSRAFFGGLSAEVREFLPDPVAVVLKRL